MQTAMDKLARFLERRRLLVLGIGLSVAIALDATLVRLILVPATMEIMGRWNWWLPRPMARILPRADFEASERAPARA